MDFGLLTVPLTMIAMAFGFAVVTDTQTVNIDKITIPASLSGGPSTPASPIRDGYTPEVVIAQLADEMHEIERQAQSRATGRRIQLKGTKNALTVLADYLKVTPLIRVAQESAGLIPFSLSGEIVVAGKNLELELRGHGAESKSVRIVTQAPADQMPALIKTAAYEAMRVVDPYILAAYQFKKDFRSRDFTQTLDIIGRELANKESNNRKWLYNLWGMILYQQADRAGAVEKFKAALEVDPSFASAMINLGVVQSRQGDHEAAIRLFRKVVEDRWSDTVPATKAAAASEWGFTLALLGRFDEAFAKFKQASEIDPGFADVYASWAEVLSALGRGDEADAMTRRAIKLAPTEVIYTENLVGPVQRLPATASAVN